MRLWTIQKPDVWHALQTDGVWCATESLVPEYQIRAYHWMIRQMETRLGKRVVPGQMPVWVWYQWDTAKRKRPDLRSGGHFPRGSPGVRIEMDIDEKRVLLSDFVLWHYVLNYWYLPHSFRDEREFQRDLKVAGMCYFKTQPLPDKTWHQKIEKSWERIFDLSWANRRYASKRDEKSIQGVMWELQYKDVHVVDAFIAR